MTPSTPAPGTAPAGETGHAPRRVAATTLLTGLLAGGLVLWLRVPWDPVPWGPVSPVPAGEVLTGEQVERAEAFATPARAWSYAALAVSLLVAALLGLSRRGRGWLRRLPGPWPVRVPGMVAVVLTVSWLAALPLDAAGHAHARDAGLATQPWAGWARDQGVAHLLTLVVWSLVLLAVVGLARRWRTAWPALAGVLLAGLVLLGSFVYPVVVAPLFRDVQPLPPGALREQVLTLARDEGVALSQVYVSDASARTTTLNASVAGLGETRQMVLYDTLLDAAPRREVLAVVAHELAHARHRDVLTGSLLGASGAVVAAGVAGLVLAGRPVRRGRPGRSGEWSVAGARDAVPVLVVAALLAGVVTAPVGSVVSRQLERRADADAIRATQDAAAQEAVQRRLAVRSRADPTPPPLAQWWFGSHPGVRERVAIARTYPG